MKWLLISEYGNPGDEWARLGVIEIIKVVDPEAKLVVLDKWTYEMDTPQPFDWAVFCGQPLVWSHPGHNTTMAGWWANVNGWLSKGKKLILAGWGVYASWTGDLFTEPKLHNPKLIEKEVGGLIRKSALSYCRSPIGRKIFGQDTMVLPCPSIFAGTSLPQERTLKLCNLMPNGGHEPVMARDESESWQKLCPGVSKVLMECGFTFVSHRQDEEDLAVKLGWPKERIISWDKDPMHLLAPYAKAERYWGNRVHGAIVTAGFGGDAHCCCYDTRAAAVRMVGGSCVRPSKADPEAVRKWAIEPPVFPKVLSVQEEFEKQVELFRRVTSRPMPAPKA